MDYLNLLLLLVSVLLVIVLASASNRITIYEYERGLKYNRGRFVRVLEPGSYRYWTYATTIRKVDIRPRYESITGQEVLSADNVGLKVSLAATYEIADPYIAVNKVENFVLALHLELQIALREIISATEVDEILAKRQEIGAQLYSQTEAKIGALGLRLLSIGIKDIMFPGDLKKVFAQVVQARKEGQAALERARGETAALRSLANAARMIEDNPALLQLRLLQALSEGSGNSVVLATSPQTTPLLVSSPKREQKTETSEGAKVNLD
jgi:regulator of protease activity HflC (stomatin/prohibitin superfamily)